MGALRVVPLSAALLTIAAVFAFASTADAASSRLYLYEEVVTVEIDEEDGEEYEVYDTITTVIEDGGTYPVDLDQLYQLGLESDAEVNHEPPSQHILSFKAKLHRIDSDSGEREHVTNIFGPDGVWDFTWEEAGEYELDVYAWDEPVPILSQVPWWERLFAYFLPVAYAQIVSDYEEYIETISFTITDENALPECCSNVLFIPGIKGSVLKSGDDSLWPPTLIQTFNGGISSLALTEAGESENPVFVDGVLETFYSVPVYGPFMEFMDDMVADGAINEWRALPYDWRFSAETILEEGIQTESELLDVVAEIEELAENSDTGQVTIVAHSMGGLFGKAIIKKLTGEGKDDLIDAFVMVGSPQLGTPQAVAGLLHGGGESIGLGFIVNPATARSIAQNMPSAHDLLPSPRYFDAVADPVITFDSGSDFTSAWRGAWGDSIDSYAEFKEFLTGQGVARSEPAFNNLSAPEVLRTELVQDAADLHEEYDDYTIPEHIRTVQIVGWGMPTVKAVHYRDEHMYPSYRVVNTIEGDSTVVYASATSQSNGLEEYFFNADKYRLSTANIQHKDLLSASPIQSLLQSLIKEEEISLGVYITEEKPNATETNDVLLLSTYSPIILGVYDENGNFTGIDPDQDLSSDFLFVTEEIPGSSFRAFGESQQIFLPPEGNYTVMYKGVGNGSTTVEIATFQNDEEEIVAAFTDIPTSNATIAEFDVDADNPEAVVIAIDQNGDGTTDEEILPDGSEPQELSLEELTELLQTEIQGSSLQKPIKRQLIALVTAFEKVQNTRNQFLRRLLSEVAFGLIKAEVELLKKKKKLPAAEAAELLDILAKIKQKL